MGLVKAPRKRGTRTRTRKAFPADWVTRSTCHARFADPGFYTWTAGNGSTFGRSFTSHTPHSETRGQRSYLFSLARKLGYQHPPQTCCANQANVLIAYLLYRLDTHKHESPQDSPPT